MLLVRAAVVLVLCLLLGACGGGDEPTAEPRRSPTSIAQLDADGMRVVRVAFCDLVPPKAVRAALKAAPTRARSWRNGDEVKDAGGEIGHEFGCAWFGPHGRVARAWVFARPVTPAFARSLVLSAGKDRGCRAVAGTGFGNPSVVQNCLRSPDPRRIRYAGLFGQSWLSCEVSGHGTRRALRTRANSWCAAVAGALDAGRR